MIVCQANVINVLLVGAFPVTLFSTKTDHTLPCGLQQGFRCRAGRRPIPLPHTPSPVHLSCLAHTPPIFQKGAPPREDVEPPEAGMSRPLSPSTLLHTAPADVRHQVEEAWLATMPVGRQKGTIWETYSSSSRKLWGWMPGQERKRFGAWPILSFGFPEVVRSVASPCSSHWHTGRAGCTSLMASQELLSFLEGNVCGKWIKMLLL